ncbi:MAG: hypothetical protein QM758_05070 [Armatimonas sp.]
MLTQQIAIVSEIAAISTSELTRVGAALQKQAVRDLGPLWDIQATVDPFVRLEDVPLGYWPVIIRDDIETDGAAGVHLDNDGQPFALVQFSPNWSLTSSHEILEMLVDPFGSRLVAGNSVKPGQGRVEYLVEVSDPSEAAQFGYTVNGILVSDFYTPQYFDPMPAAGVRYSFTGAITKPRQVLPGGYLSWHDPETNHWFQQRFFGANPQEFHDLGILTGARGSIRSQIDRKTEEARAQILATAQEVESNQEFPAKNGLTAAVGILPTREIEKGSMARAERLKDQIEQLRQGGGA